MEKIFIQKEEKTLGFLLLKDITKPKIFVSLSISSLWKTGPSEIVPEQYFWPSEDVFSFIPCLMAKDTKGSAMGVCKVWHPSNTEITAAVLRRSLTRRMPHPGHQLCIYISLYIHTQSVKKTQPGTQSTEENRQPWYYTTILKTNNL